MTRSIDNLAGAIGFLLCCALVGLWFGLAVLP